MILSNNIPRSWLLWSGIICIIYSVSWLWMEKEAKLSTPGQLLLLTKKHIFLFVDPSLYACYCWKNVTWGICVSLCLCVSLSWFQRGTLKLLDPFKVWVKAHDFGWPTKITNVYAKLKTNYYWETHLVLDFWDPNENEGFQCEKKQQERLRIKASPPLLIVLRIKSNLVKNGFATF